MKVLKIFEEIPLPIYVMGGEQNRQILYNMKYLNKFDTETAFNESLGGGGRFLN